jgi:hypothetical protein
MSSYCRHNENVVLSGDLSYGVAAKQFGGRAGMLFACMGMGECCRMRVLRFAFALALALPLAAQAQQPQQQPQTWNQLPRMQLERQFAGPLQDTLIQRWRDPADGTICYIYLPITAPHSPPTQSGYVQYGANTIGSISCMAAGASPPRPAPPAAASPPANLPAKK